MPAPNKKHPGISLLKPANGRKSWRARYEDPDTRKMVWETTPKHVKTKRQRATWAESIFIRISKRRDALAAGEKPSDQILTIPKGVERYFRNATKELMESTIGAYRDGTNVFEAWCSKNGVETLHELDRRTLKRFREARIDAPKHTAQKGKGIKRGKRKVTNQKRSAAAVNRELRAVGTMLRWLEDEGELPRAMSLDDIKMGLKTVSGNRDRPEFLKAKEVKQLLQAALDHDAVTWKITREEHARGVTSGHGVTPKYTPMAPWIAVMILSGMRLSEGLGLKWEQIELYEVDGHHGGEIYLQGKTVKTHSGRAVGFEESPSLRDILAAMKPENAIGPVFPEHTKNGVKSAQERLIRTYQAPKWSPQLLRSTCATYLSSAPSIYKGASVVRSARRLGHSTQVADNHYIADARWIPRNATTLDSAMQVESELHQIVASLKNKG